VAPIVLVRCIHRPIIIIVGEAKCIVAHPTKISGGPPGPSCSVPRIVFYLNILVVDPIIIATHLVLVLVLVLLRLVDATLPKKPKAPSF